MTNTNAVIIPSDGLSNTHYIGSLRKHTFVNKIDRNSKPAHSLNYFTFVNTECQRTTSSLDKKNIVFIEGPDCSGKTTLINQIQDTYGAIKIITWSDFITGDEKTDIRKRVELALDDKEKHKDILVTFFGIWERALISVLEDKGRVFVFDRFFISTLIYQYLYFNLEGEITEDKILELIENDESLRPHLKSLFALLLLVEYRVLYLKVDEDILEERLIAKAQSPDSDLQEKNTKKMVTIAKIYREFFKS